VGDLDSCPAKVPAVVVVSMDVVVTASLRAIASLGTIVVVVVAVEVSRLDGGGEQEADGYRDPHGAWG
jgi:hypothetical protein